MQLIPRGPLEAIQRPERPAAEPAGVQRPHPEPRDGWHCQGNPKGPHNTHPRQPLLSNQITNRGLPNELKKNRGRLALNAPPVAQMNWRNGRPWLAPCVGDHRVQWPTMPNDANDTAAARGSM